MVKCEYCGQYLDRYFGSCDHCGAPINGANYALDAIPGHIIPGSLAMDEYKKHGQVSYGSTCFCVGDYRTTT